jgi:hypothetical protein
MFTCNSVEFIFCQNAETDSLGVIVPLSGFSFEEISSKEKNIYKEKGKSKDGNTLYEQTLDVQYKYSDIAKVQSMSNQHYILKLQKTDGSYFVWGTLSPYNPVQVNISLSEGIASLEFYRDSVYPEN